MARKNTVFVCTACGYEHSIPTFVVRKFGAGCQAGSQCPKCKARGELYMTVRGYVAKPGTPGTHEAAPAVENTVVENVIVDVDECGLDFAMF